MCENQVGVQIRWRFFITTGCIKAAPGPVGGVTYNVGVNRVVDDVSAVLKVLILLFDDPRFIPSLEDRATAFISEVVELAVKLVEELHSPGEVRIRCFDKKMIVVFHEAVGMADPVELLHHPFLKMEELLPIPVVMIDHHLPDTPAYDVIEGSRELDSQRSDHNQISLSTGVREMTKDRPNQLPGNLF